MSEGVSERRSRRLERLDLSTARSLSPEMNGAGVAHPLPLGSGLARHEPTTGLVIFAFTKAAASSSAVPPISPIMMTASVFGSAWKAKARR